MKVLEAKLDEQHELFCRCYVKHFNGAKAVVEAGYKDTSEKAVSVQAARLLGNVRVQKRIRELVAHRLKRIELDGDQILKEIQKVAYFDVRKLYDENNVMLPVKDWPLEVAMCIQAVETFEVKDHRGRIIGHTQKIKMWDKLRALELLGKNKQLFNEHQQVTNNTVVMVVDEEQARAIRKKILSDC